MITYKSCMAMFEQIAFKREVTRSKSINKNVPFHTNFSYTTVKTYLEHFFEMR